LKLLPIVFATFRASDGFCTEGIFAFDARMNLFVKSVTVEGGKPGDLLSVACAAHARF